MRILAAMALVPSLFAVEIGGRPGDFTLTSLQGGRVTAASLSGGVTVVLFVSTKGPVSNRYNQRMIEAYRDYSPKGVKFIFVNSNSNEPPAEIEEHARQSGFPFPVYKDEDNRVADLFGAGFTPEAYVLDRSGTLRYHGRIDDAQNEARIQHRSLRLALDAVLAGSAVESAGTKAFGCTIKRAKKVS